jgi:flagellar motor switch protein FliG
MSPGNSNGGLHGLRKAAILVVLLGEEAAAQIYKHLPEDDLQLLTQEIAELGYVSPDEASQVLQEFYRLALTQEYLARGGPDYARRLLVKAFGESGASTLLEQVLRAQEARAHKLDRLNQVDPNRLAKLIEREHPQTIALILGHLGTAMAAAVLRLLPERTRVAAVRRLAQMQQFSPEVVQRIALVLHGKLESLGEQRRRSYGGVEAVAEMLNRLDPVTAKAILDAIEQDNAELALAIRNSMFTFEDLLGVPEASIRELLAQVDKKTLALALKGASEQLRAHFFKAMSSRAVEMLREDMEALGPVRAREVARAQQEIVNLARTLEAQGKIILKAEAEESLVV